MSLKEKQYELIQNITKLAEQLGWKIVIPKNEEDEDTVVGLIMGTHEFFEQVHMDPDNIEDIIEFEGSGRNPEDDSKLH